MSPALSNSLIDILLASGASSRDDAAALATNLNGSSWTADVLNSGKVDEQRFLTAIGDFFHVPVISIDAKRIERATLGRAAEPVRFPAPDPADRGEGERRRPRDLRSLQLHRPPARRAAARQARRVGARPARAAPARDENALRRRRGDLRRNPQNQPRLRGASGHRDAAPTSTPTIPTRRW